MSEIVDFMLEHWQLSSILIVLVVAYVFFETRQGSLGGTKMVSPEVVVDLYNHQQAVLLDIRTEKAFKEGHIVGATHVDNNEPDNKLNKYNKYAQRPVIIITADGKNADQFMSRLTKHGLTKVLSLSGGINAWRSAGLPLINKNNK